MRWVLLPLLCGVVLWSGCSSPSPSTAAPTNPFLGKLDIEPIAKEKEPEIDCILLHDGRLSIFGLLNPWAIVRESLEDKKTESLLSGNEIVLRSDRAVEHLCRLRGTDTNSHWFASFHDHAGNVLARRKFSEDLLLKLPELEKAVDNNGQLLKDSRPIFFSNR